SPRAATPAAAPPARRHFWQRTRPSEDAEPAASLAPEHVLAGLAPQEPVACFFCGRPLTPDQAEVGAVALGGLPLEPLVCQRAAAVAAQAAVTSSAVATTPKCWSMLRSVASCSSWL